MIHIGIDPGAKGGVAVVDEQGELQQCFPLKPETLIQCLTADAGRCFVVRNEAHAKQIDDALRRHVTIEKAQAFPGQGVNSMFNYGKGAGIIEGILIALGIPYDLVAPGRWHSAMLHGAEGATPKARAWSRCQQLFPNHYNSFLKPRGGVHDGMVDAALIAEYGRRTFNGRSDE